jgi:hypothetical protein
VSWSHSEEIIVYYKLEFGIGIKMGGVEQFKLIYEGDKNFFILRNL